jgi:hypothetical protein
MADVPVDLNASLISSRFSEFQNKTAMDDTLFHYTDQAGLLGIIKDAELVTAHP